MAVNFNTLNGIPLQNPGYSPNTRPNNSQVILRNKFDNNGILSISTATIYPGFFVSKANSNPNDVTFILPTQATVEAGNIWLMTEGLIPDSLGIDTVQGDLNGQPVPFTNGMSANFIPLPQVGTLIRTYVNFANGATLGAKALYLRTSGDLTTDNTDGTITDTTFIVGYIYQSAYSTIPAAGQYQTEVIVSPRTLAS